MQELNDDKEQPNACIEDLTLRETEATAVKGGSPDRYLLDIAGVKGESDPHQKR